jgi:hypothetical protein
LTLSWKAVDLDNSFWIPEAVAGVPLHLLLARRSPGVIWEHLDDDTVEAIPVLAARRPRQRSQGS